MYTHWELQAGDWILPPPLSRWVVVWVESAYSTVLTFPLCYLLILTSWSFFVILLSTPCKTSQSELASRSTFISCPCTLTCEVDSNLPITGAWCCRHPGKVGTCLLPRITLRLPIMAHKVSTDFPCHGILQCPHQLPIPPTVWDPSFLKAFALTALPARKALAWGLCLISQFLIIQFSAQTFSPRQGPWGQTCVKHPHYPPH